MEIRALVIPICVVFGSFGANAQNLAGLASELTAFTAARKSHNGPTALEHALAVQRIARTVERPADAPKFVLEIERPADSSLSVAGQIEKALKVGDIVRMNIYADALPVLVLKEITPVGPEHFEETPEPEDGGVRDISRIFRLFHLAPAALEAGDLAAAASYASELLATASRYPNLFTGEATYSANTVAGRVALQLNDVPAASAFLIAAGKTAGSPTLNSFGPGMLLASELLARGERTSVLEYLAGCRTFWTHGDAALDQWTALIQQGKTPQFGKMRLKN